MSTQKLKKVVPADRKLSISGNMRRTMEDLLEEMQEQSELEQRIAEKKAKILEWLMDQSEKTFRGDGASFTVVTGETSTIDDELLESLVGQRKFRDISKRVTDKKLLEAAISLKKVDVSDVAKATITKAKKPYLKVTKS